MWTMLNWCMVDTYFLQTLYAIGACDSDEQRRIHGEQYLKTTTAATQRALPDSEEMICCLETLGSILDNLIQFSL